MIEAFADFLRESNRLFQRVCNLWGKRRPRFWFYDHDGMGHGLIVAFAWMAAFDPKQATCCQKYSGTHSLRLLHRTFDSVQRCR